MPAAGPSGPTSGATMQAAATVAAVVVPLAAAGLLAVASATSGRAGVGVVVLLLQVPLVLAWFALSGATGTGVGFGLAVVALGASDLALATDEQATTRALAPIVGLSLLAAFAHQLSRRRGRVGSTMSMAAVVSAILISGAAACWLAVRALPLGRDAVTVAVSAVVGALVAGRVADLALPGPKVVPGGLRGPVGAALALVAAVAAGGVAGGMHDTVGVGNGVLLALLVAVAVVTTDLAVDMIAAGLPVTELRARSAVPPIAGLLPLVAAAPAAYVAGRLLLG